MKKCAIVILNYNGEKVLPVFLPSVVKFSQFDVWVIDNASTDSSVQFLKNQFSQIRLIELASNFGYAGGYNWGLEQLRGQYEYFILLNSDVEVIGSWDVDMVSWMDAHPEYTALQPKILSWQDKGKFDYAGAGGGYLDALGYPYCRGRIWNVLEDDHGQYNDEAQVDWASGACMVIKAADFFRQDGFDAHFFAHMEEIDLCWRLRLEGKKIGYLGKVAVYHQGGATLARTSPRKLYLNIRNSLSMLYKNQASGKFWAVFLIKIGIELASALGYLIAGKMDLARAVGKGYRDFFQTRHLFSKTHIKKPEQVIPRSGSVNLIFWHFFVLRKKTFADL
ncbi:glycosyltransferase family 2 protein [Algoriphagus mannitolivorans]|uniref:glycosyltransferase family 2 protein n=1 Tax=Algoriphagus mannitolivorans TaxID=226504 RepID=UPI0004216608|nr:glycosyltransferase family 2 protein [Algoriphagus mannitolivorans]